MTEFVVSVPGGFPDTFKTPNTPEKKWPMLRSPGNGPMGWRGGGLMIGHIEVDDYGG